MRFFFNAQGANRGINDARRNHDFENFISCQTKFGGVFPFGFQASIHRRVIDRMLPSMNGQIAQQMAKAFL